MLKKTIKYVDFDGNERTEDFHFNLTKVEVTELSVSKKEGLETYVKRIVDAKDNGEIFNTFKQIIMMAYGEKSPDGRRFIKKDHGEKLADAFVETAAFDQLITDLLSDETGKAASDFIQGILPTNA